MLITTDNIAVQRIEKRYTYHRVLIVMVVSSPLPAFVAQMMGLLDAQLAHAPQVIITLAYNMSFQLHYIVNIDKSLCPIYLGYSHHQYPSNDEAF